MVVDPINQYQKL